MIGFRSTIPDSLIATWGMDGKLDMAQSTDALASRRSSRMICPRRTKPPHPQREDVVLPAWYGEILDGLVQRGMIIHQRHQKGRARLVSQKET